jgi:CheY-like chemotaxis protein
MPEMDGFAFVTELHEHKEWRILPIKEILRSAA